MIKKAFIFGPKPFFGSIDFKGGLITKLREEKKLPSRIDTIVVPGFISTHVHTVQTLARNTAENLELLDWLEKVVWPFEASLTKKTTYESASLGMNECLRFGITTILDMATSRHSEEVFKAARDSGIRAFIGKALMDRGPRSLVDPHPLKEVHAHLADWHGAEQGRLQVTLSPRFILSCSDKLLKDVGEWSRKSKLIQHTHASENLKECALIKKRTKKSNIEILAKLGALTPTTVIAHGVHLNDKDRALLKKYNVSISHCPTSNLKLASGIADIKNMKGINLSLGVDGAPCNNLLDPFFEMRLAHLLNRSIHGLKGLSAKQIFEIATLGGARALHAEKDLGSIEIGKKADLVVIKVPPTIYFNPKFAYESLLHSLTARDIENIYINGSKIGV